MGGREELLAAFTAWADTHPPGTRYRVDEYGDDRVRFSVATDEDIEATLPSAQRRIE